MLAYGIGSSISRDVDDWSTTPNRPSRSSRRSLRMSPADVLSVVGVDLDLKPN
jgi:hypothetical protein